MQDDSGYISEQHAVELIRNPLAETRASSEIESAVWHRISGYDVHNDSATFSAHAFLLLWRYPAHARDHIHYARAQLPVNVAKALAVNPSLAQKAVETFYTRDALQLRVSFVLSYALFLNLTLTQAAHRMARFPPEPSAKMTVKLTRAAYAQLMGQKFYPPKIFGRWTEPEDSLEYKVKDLGMKIVRARSTTKDITYADDYP